MMSLRSNEPMLRGWPPPAWLLAICLPLLAVGCSHDVGGVAKAGDADAPKAARPVQVVQVRRLPWPRTVRVQGSLLSDEHAVIGSKLSGRVDKVLVDLGSIVQEGQPLVVLDQRELQLRVVQAMAHLRQACAAIGSVPEDDESQLRHTNAPPVMLEQALVDEATTALARAEQLARSGGVTRSELERLQAQLRTANARYLSALNGVSEHVATIGVRRAELALAEQQLADAQIIAPFDGVVAQRRVSTGEYVQLGQAVIAIVRADRLRFTAGVPENKAARIRTGQRLLVYLKGQSAPLETAVTRVSPTLTQASRALWIEADLDNSDLQLQAGLFAEADVFVDTDATTLAVPVAAVSRFAGVQKVWVVRDNQASQQTIVTGRQTDQLVEVLDGLQSGDLIVSKSSQGRSGPVVASEEAPAVATAADNSEQGSSE